ncbi:hypothetical protein [Helicobacter rodentium]|nr:hypothetical protein [Helicobacter rodentium]
MPRKSKIFSQWRSGSFKVIQNYRLQLKAGELLMQCTPRFR